MKLKPFGKIIASMYTDKIRIRGYRDEVDQNTGAVHSVLSDIVKDAPCRISFSSQEKASDKDVDTIPVSYQPKVFISSEIEVKAGDEVVIYRLNDDGDTIEKYYGKAGLCSSYPTHKEFNFHMNTDA